MTPLLDVNVLVALAWPNHVHHGVARAWFRLHSPSGWATCPLTESGFVRVSSHPAVPHAATPADAIAVLGLLRDLPGHAFWDDDISIVSSPHIDRPRIASHRQVTDAHLVGVARRHGGSLATLDRRLPPLLARGEDDPAVVLIAVEG